MSTPYRISGSRAAAILGLSPYQTPVQVWLQIMEEIKPGFCEKNKFEKPEYTTNNPMIWGTAFEDEIIRITEIIHKIKISEREKLFIIDDFISCHPDGISIDVLIENKTTSEYYYKDNFGEENTDQIPINYQIQVQHNMICTKKEKCLMPVLIFPKRPDDYVNLDIDIEKINKRKWVEVLLEMGNVKFYEITAHKELQDLMIKHYTDFWNNYVLTGKAPEPKTYGDIKRLVREPVGTIIADENIERLMSEYKHIKSEIGQGGGLSKRIEQIKIEVMQYMTDQTGVIDDDSQDKFILRNQSGKKIASYSKNKNGSYVFR